MAHFDVICGGMRWTRATRLLRSRAELIVAGEAAAHRLLTSQAATLGEPAFVNQLRANRPSERALLTAIIAVAKERVAEIEGELALAGITCEPVPWTKLPGEE
jgi:hypothetical protein